MKLLSLTVVSTDDWEGVYDQYGKLVDEGHTINWIRLLKRNVAKVSRYYYADPLYMNTIGNMPKLFSELDKTKIKEYEIG